MALLQVSLAVLLTFAVTIVTALPLRQQTTPLQTSDRWYKGNTHTHTLNSDGDSTPDDVVRWYREHRYQFLVLTDHNFLTSVDGLNALHGADEKFLVIKGEEVSDRFGDKPLHVNALDPNAVVPPQGGSSVADVLQRNVDAIRRANGIPHINHPSFRWSVTAEELQQVQNNRLFEVFNGHPQVNNAGGGGVPGLEEAWDAILTSGTLLYGVAVDDAHVFKAPGNPDVAGPGRGWVVVRAPRLEARAILDALERGDFYASTGVELTDYQATARQITVSVKATDFSKYRIQFIGKGGRVLREVSEPAATYEIRGDEGYVRVRVLESNGRVAWGQPIIVSPRLSVFAGFAGLWLVVMIAVASLSAKAARPLRFCAWLVLSVGSASCAAPAIDVVFYVNDGYTFTPAEQRTIETIATRAALDARHMLPGLPGQLILRVNPGTQVMAETGQTGGVSSPNIVHWMVDPNLYGGVTAIAKRQLRSTLLHEFYHLARASDTNGGAIMDRVVEEGLATAFERDFGDAPTPWGTYPPDVADWVKELDALPPNASKSAWMSRHPDGRRWVGYKVGTYLADQVMRATGKSAPDLVSASTEEILEMAFKGQSP